MDGSSAYGAKKRGARAHRAVGKQLDPADAKPVVAESRVDTGGNQAIDGSVLDASRCAPELVRLRRRWYARKLVASVVMSWTVVTPRRCGMRQPRACLSSVSSIVAGGNDPPHQLHGVVLQHACRLAGRVLDDRAAVGRPVSRVMPASFSARLFASPYARRAARRRPDGPASPRRSPRASEALPGQAS